MKILLKKHPDKLTKLANEPFVGIVDGIVTEEEANYIIDKADGKINPARVVLSDKIGASKGRSGGNCWLRYKEDKTINAIGQRIADIVGLPLDTAESMQVIYYDKGQEYRHHFDAFDLNTERGQRAAKWGGQRILTALVYLNQVKAGGGTDFKKLGVTVEPKIGRLVVFHNTSESIEIAHPNSLHAGLPVEEGEKWAFNIWFHQHKVKEECIRDDYKELPSIKFI
jgi:prolyl 4-hydroxylase